MIHRYYLYEEMLRRNILISILYCTIHYIPLLFVWGSVEKKYPNQYLYCTIQYTPLLFVWGSVEKKYPDEDLYCTDHNTPLLFYQEALRGNEPRAPFTAPSRGQTQFYNESTVCPDECVLSCSSLVSRMDTLFRQFQFAGSLPLCRNWILGRIQGEWEGGGRGRRYSSQKCVWAMPFSPSQPGGEQNQTLGSCQEIDLSNKKTNDKTKQII